MNLKKKIWTSPDYLCVDSRAKYFPHGIRLSLSMNGGLTLPAPSKGAYDRVLWKIIKLSWWYSYFYKNKNLI